MRTTLPILFAFLLCIPPDAAAQIFGPDPKTEKDVLEEFARANGGSFPPLVTDKAQATVYISFDNARGITLATTNYKTDATQALPLVRVLNGVHEPSVLESIFDPQDTSVPVTALPVWFHNDVFRVFLDSRFLDDFKNASVVSQQGRRYPIRKRMAEIRPGFFVTPNIPTDNIVSFLYERSFDFSDAEALSLLNNKDVNDALSGAFKKFQPIRTVDQIEKTFAAVKTKSVCLIGHISTDGQVLRYRSNGEVSYELPVTQFLHLAADLKKEVILIGCNYADDTSRTVDVAAETKILEAALQHQYWGEVLQTLAGEQNQVQMKEENTDGFYFKRAEVTRPEGVKPGRAYTFIYFKTPAKPTAFMAGLRFVYGQSGKILSVLVVLQILFFFVFKGKWARTLKWVNLALLFVFLLAFLFSSI